MRKLTLSTRLMGGSRYDKGKKLTVKDYEWAEVVTLLTTFKVTDELFQDYLAMDSLDKLAAKDVGYFVGGKFDPPYRKTFNLIYRDLLVLDLDHLLSMLDVDEIRETFGKYAFIVHSSHSHSNGKPRLRIAFPLTRSVTPEEYEPLARMVASQLDMELFDDTTYQFSRVMFTPSRSKDGDEYTDVNDGEWLDPDYFLGLYEDWEDVGSWPKSSRQQQLRSPTLRAQNPYNKPGVIGGFNRAYSIPEAIEVFALPYEPSGKGDDRYSYVPGESADGAIYYPDDGHLFSHHESDPAHGNHNAFDLVRLHKFSALDDGVDEENTSATRMPSFLAMRRMALADKLVKAELSGADLPAEDDFEVVEEEEETGTEVPPVPEKLQAITFNSVQLKINRADDQLTTDQYNEVVDDIAVLGPDLSSTELASLSGQIAKKHPLSGVTKTDVKADLKKGIKEAKDQATNDIQMDMIKLVMKKHFDEGKIICRINGVYWKFSEGRWDRVHDEIILGKIDQEVMALRSNNKKEYRQLQQATDGKDTSAITGALSPVFARHCANLPDDPIDPLKLNRRYDHPLINTRNCEIHFSEDGSYEVRKHEPQSFLGVRLDVKYDPKAECPEWDRFCQLIFRNHIDPEDSQRHLEEWMGYVINMQKWQKKFAIFVGHTDAGKTTIVEILKMALGDAYLEMPITFLSEDRRNTFALGSLLNKLLVVDEERSKTGYLPDAALKSLSEEKSISTEVKHSNVPLNFTSRAFPLVVSNFWPHAADTSAAFERRVLVWHMADEIPEEEKSDVRRDAMLKEGPGILNKMIAGLSRLRKRGTFDLPLENQEAKREWVMESNPVAQFLDVALECEKDLPKSHCLGAEEVYRQYENWAADVKRTPSKYILQSKEFFARMADQGHPKVGRVDSKMRIKDVKKLVKLRVDSDF